MTYFEYCRETKGFSNCCLESGSYSFLTVGSQSRRLKTDLDSQYDVVRSREMFSLRSNTIFSVFVAPSMFSLCIYCHDTSESSFHISALADAYGCKILANSDKARAKPQYKKQPAKPIYSCTPGNSSTQYEVHVLAVYEVINRRPPSAGNATVNIVSRGRSERPVILVLGSYEPVNWILNLPADITISKVILVSTKSKGNLRSNSLRADKRKLFYRKGRWP